MSNPLQFSAEFGGPHSDQQPKQNEPLRILFLTDLGKTCRSRTEVPVASRPMRLVDVDTFDALLEAEQPVIHLPSGDVRLQELDDLHPEQLCKSLPIFQTLIDLRRRLRKPESFEAAAQEVRDLLKMDVAPSPTAPSVDEENDADTLSRLLGKPPEPTSRAVSPAREGGFLNDLVQKAVQAHVVPDADPRAEDYIKGVDAAAAAHLRAVLHDPSFQSFEAAWRGLHLLTSNIETDNDLSIRVWNVAKSELIEAMGPAGGSPEGTVLHQKIVHERHDEPFTLIISDITFGSDADDLRLLATLGALAGRSGAIVVAGVAPEVIGAKSWDAIAKAPSAPLEPDTGWSALRDSGLGSRIVAVAPRFMLRTPYGKRLDQADTFFEFEELEQPGDAEAPFLWGTSSLLATILIAQSFAQEGWDARLNTNLAYDDLPFVPFEQDGEKQLKPCAEVQLSDRAAETILNAGPIPVVSVRNHNEVRLSWFQSIFSQSDSGQVGPFSL